MEYYESTCTECGHKWRWVGYKTSIGKTAAQLAQMKIAGTECPECGGVAKKGLDHTSPEAKALGEVVGKALADRPAHVDIPAKVMMLDTRYGGRKGAFDPGFKYRPHVRIEGDQEEHGVGFDFDGEPIAPGEVDREVRLRFLAPNLAHPKIRSGKCFEIREGLCCVGVGVFL